MKHHGSIDLPQASIDYTSFFPPGDSGQNWGSLQFRRACPVLLRFGRSMARLRSKYQSQIQKDAKRVVKNNLKNVRSSKGLDYNASAKWIKWANLQPILDYLL